MVILSRYNNKPAVAHILRPRDHRRTKHNLLKAAHAVVMAGHHLHAAVLLLQATHHRLGHFAPSC
jgi:hypothetical protein